MKNRRLLKVPDSSAAAGQRSEGRRGGGHGSVGRHQALEFYKPVEDDVVRYSTPGSRFMWCNNQAHGDLRSNSL
ncbi:MAG: hypothetical protein V3T23_06095 [Nitrososphaerales archaeon]